MGSQQLFCLRWSNHQTNMLNVFDQLLQSEALVDVTLACEGLSLRAHKVVLSACSPYFQHLFIENPCKHPIVILKDIKYTDLKALVDFMYKGEVNVTQEQLSALLKTAETLKVKGLAEMTGGSPGAATQHATANSIPPVPTHSGSSIPPHPVLPQLPRSPSPPNKRKKVRQRRPSSEQTPSSDLDDTDSLEIRGSPEVIETKVEVPSEAFGPERSADQDSRPEHTSDMKMDVTPNSSEDNAVVYQSPVHAVANNSTSLVQPTTANTPPSTLLPPPPLLPSTLPSTSGSQPTSQERNGREIWDRNHILLSALELFKSGFTLSQAAATYGIHKTTLWRLARKEGLSTQRNSGLQNKIAAFNKSKLSYNIPHTTKPSTQTNPSTLDPAVARSREFKCDYQS